MSQTPAGWKLVPIQATKEMEAAATKRIRPYHDILDREWRSRVPGDFFRLAWPALLDAAPESPTDHVMGGEPTPSRPEASSTKTGALPLSYGPPSADLAEHVQPAKHVMKSEAREIIARFLAEKAARSPMSGGLTADDYMGFGGMHEQADELLKRLVASEDGVAAPVSQGSDHSLTSGRGIPQVRPPEDRSTVASSGDADFQEIDIISVQTPPPAERGE